MVPFDGNLRVVADELNNAILVYSTTAQFERIEDALRRLDVPPTQVLIEASIIEVTLDRRDQLRACSGRFGDTAGKRRHRNQRF